MWTPFYLYAFILLSFICFDTPVYALSKSSRSKPSLFHRSNLSNDICVAASQASSSSPSSSPSSSRTWWVSRLNYALEVAPLGSICSFVFIDISSCLCILAYLQWQKVYVSPEFTVAYGISKAFRFQRLALDAAGAKFITLLAPAIKEVKVGLIFEAIQEFKYMIFGGKYEEANRSIENSNRNILSRTATKATRVSSEYGLALMASKNLIGPMNHLLLYLFLKNGFDLSKYKWLSWATVSDTSAVMGRMAYASWLSTIIVPFVVIGAAFFAPYASRISHTAFPALLTRRRDTWTGK